MYTEAEQAQRRVELAQRMKRVRRRIFWEDMSIAVFMVGPIAVAIVTGVVGIVWGIWERLL